MYKNNKSGHTGVYFDNRTNKYRVFINFNGQKKRLGNYSNLDEAIRIREDAEKIYRKDFLTLTINHVNKNIDKPTAELLCYVAGYNYYFLNGNKIESSFKRYYLNYIKHIDKPLEDANQILSDLKEFWPKETREIMYKWALGFPIRQIAIIHNFAKSCIAKKILDTLSLISEVFVGEIEKSLNC